MFPEPRSSAFSYPLFLLVPGTGLIQPLPPVGRRNHFCIPDLLPLSLYTVWLKSNSCGLVPDWALNEALDAPAGSFASPADWPVHQSALACQITSLARIRLRARADTAPALQFPHLRQS